MFHLISKHLEFRQKYSAVLRIFNSLLCVWKSDETRSLVFDILYTDLDVLDSLFESIVPEAIIQPQSDELQRGLGTKCVLGGHVEIIHEINQLLATDWYINTLIETTRYNDQNLVSPQNYNKK